LRHCVGSFHGGRSGKYAGGFFAPQPPVSCPGILLLLFLFVLLFLERPVEEEEDEAAEEDGRVRYPAGRQLP
jgi:hypothetical protein